MRPVRLLVPLVLLSSLAAIAAALPAPAAPACVPTCAHESATLAFLPPVTVMESSATVTWDATDNTPHTATSVDFCFSASYSGLESGSATLTIRDGVLFGTTPRQLDERACTAAKALPDGSFVLDYYCVLHPPMKGRLVVTPEMIL